MQFWFVVCAHSLAMFVTLVYACVCDEDDDDDGGGETVSSANHQNVTKKSEI